MADIVIRPSMKFVKLGYFVVLLLICGAVFVHYGVLEKNYPDLIRDHPTPWLPLICAVFLLWPLKYHLARQSVKLTIAGDKLRYESGLVAMSTRLIQLSKVQDVRVTQRLGQRMFGIGDISIETAGEYSRLEVDNLDSPHKLAEHITNLSSQAANAGAHGLDRPNPPLTS